MVKNDFILLVRSLSALLRGITSNNKGGFYCLNCLYSFRTENKPKNDENICKKSHDYYYIEMLEKSENILKYKNYIYYSCQHWVFTWKIKHTSWQSWKTNNNYNK